MKIVSLSAIVPLANGSRYRLWIFTIFLVNTISSVIHSVLNPTNFWSAYIASIFMPYGRGNEKCKRLCNGKRRYFQCVAGCFEGDFWHSENVILVGFTWILLGFSRLKV